MRKRILWVVLATAVVLCVAPLAGAARTNTTITSYTDPTGDSGTAPDVSAVLVTGDDVSGAIVIQTTFANRTTDLSTGDVIQIGLDTDQNPSTGDPESAGADDALQVSRDSQYGYGFFKWDGAQFTQVSVASVSVSRLGHLTVRVNRADLGIGSAFSFWVFAMNGPQPTSGNADVAPDGTGA